MRTKKKITAKNRKKRKGEKGRRKGEENNIKGK